MNEIGYGLLALAMVVVVPFGMGLVIRLVIWIERHWPGGKR